MPNIGAWLGVKLRAWLRCAIGLDDDVTTTQLRVYQLSRDEIAQREWLSWWSAVRAMRERHGFRVVAAVLDRAAAQFTWIVEHDADFAAAERAMFESEERADVFARPHPDVEILRTELVDRIA